jgi:hypothetical protein
MVKKLRPRSSLMIYCVCTSHSRANSDLIGTVCSLFFPLNRFTKVKWEEQQELVKEKCLVAKVVEIIDPKNESISQAIIQTYGKYGNWPIPGTLYRISPRLVDFNLAHTLLNLVTLDFMNTTMEVSFVSLVTNPQVFANKPTFGGAKALHAEETINQRFNEFSDLGVSHAAALTLKTSQRKATKRVIGSWVR